MRIHLPNSAFLGNIDAFLKAFDPTAPDELSLTSNKEWIAIHPVVLSMVASLGLTLEPSKIYCEPFEATSKGYLERMGLFKFLKTDSGIKITEHEPAGRFIPLTQIKTSEELSIFIKDMTPLLHLKPKDAEPIKYVMSELIRNVLEHAQSKNGAIVCAQYFTKSNSIRIGIVDTGVGIKQTISKSHIVHNDFDAISLALTPGITGTTNKEGGTEFNAGAGLFFIKSIANVNRDFFMIYSGSAMYKLLKRTRESIKLYANPTKDRHSSKTDLPYWKGTIVGIDISLENTKEFSKLLELIRNTYFEAVRERKKLKLKTPKFI